MGSAALKAQEKAGQIKDVPGQIDANFGLAIGRLDSWNDGAIRLVSNIVVGLVVLAICWGFAVLARRLIERSTKRRNRDNLGEVFGGFVKSAIILPAAKVGQTTRRWKLIDQQRARERADNAGRVDDTGDDEAGPHSADAVQRVSARPRKV